MRIEKHIISLIAIFSVFAISACTPKSPAVSENSKQKIKVAATIYPLYDLLRIMGGGNIDASLVLEPGASPHTFEATPGKIKELQGVKAFFVIGAGLDDWIADIAGSFPGAKIVPFSEQVPLRTIVRKGDKAAAVDEHDGGLDPHYWLDPNLTMIMLNVIAEELVRLDPGNQADYRTRVKEYAAVLKKRDADWQAKMSGLERKKIIVFHDAWNYFADHYGLEIAASFEPFPGKMPSPQYLADLQSEVAAQGIKTLFVEPQLSAEALNTLASDLGVKVAVLDPLGGSAGRSSYLDLIDYNINTIYESLK